MSDKQVAVGSDERREIARELRFNAWTALHMNTSDDFAREVFRATMNEAVGDYRAAIKRLSELIEPEPERTCRNTSPLSYKFTCSECHSSYRFGCEHGVWYCPFCGAKVVGND